MVSAMKVQSAVIARSWRVIGAAIVVALASSCGGRPPPPKRGVVEKNLGEWKFWRYQELLDVEVWVPGNMGVAHTASYVQRDAQRGKVRDEDVVHAFVTRYKTNKGIQARLLVFVRRLAREAGYLVEEDQVKKTRMVKVSGHGELWVMWASGRHLVKLGGRARETVPNALISAYAERYPSALEPGFLDGALPPGEKAPAAKEQKYDEKNPQPDWEDYRNRQSEPDGD